MYVYLEFEPRGGMRMWEALGLLRDFSCEFLPFGGNEVPWPSLKLGEGLPVTCVPPYLMEEAEPLYHITVWFSAPGHRWEDIRQWVEDWFRRRWWKCRIVACDPACIPEWVNLPVAPAPPLTSPPREVLCEGPTVVVRATPIANVVAVLLLILNVGALLFGSMPLATRVCYIAFVLVAGFSWFFWQLKPAGTG